MSTLKVQSVQHASAASPAITLDANGQATLNGLAFPTSGSLSGRNRIINGDMRIDQRNAGASISLTGSEQYTVDRFNVRTATGSGHTAIRSTTAPAGFTNSLLITIGTGASPSSVASNYIFQNIEGFNVADLGLGSANATSFTLSFWVRSSLTGQFSGAVRNSAGNRGYPFAYTISSANTFERKIITIPGDTTGTWLADNSTGLMLMLDLGCGSNVLGTAGSWVGSDIRGVTGSTQLVATSGATFYITGVQLEAGTVATPFERRSYGQELALCQRYYQELGAGAVGLSNATGAFIGFGIQYPVVMRAVPTASLKTTTLTAGDCHVAVRTSTSSAILYSSLGYSSGVKGLEIQLTGWTTTANKVHVLYGNDIAFSSEL